MWRSTPLSDDEVARRKVLGAALYAQKIFPPLYRFSTMEPETVLHGSFGSSSPVKTLCIFAGEDGVRRPRLEVHTFERGTVEVGAPILWLSNFGTAVSATSKQTTAVPVTVSGSPVSGLLLAATAEGWMVSIQAPDATVLIIGPGEVSSPLSLEPVDLQALKRSEFRNSGADET
jgi:hypothetical protein